MTDNLVRPLLSAIVESASFPSLIAFVDDLPLGHELRGRFLVIATRNCGPPTCHGAATRGEAVRLLFAMLEPGARYLFDLKVADVEAMWEEVDSYLAAPRRQRH